jgi:hypothetical protein
MMFGFASHRREQLLAELRRIAGELPQLGVERAWLAGDLALGEVLPESELEIVLVHETAEPFHRRADFFSTHLRPCVGTRFIVYTPEEFRDLETSDRILVAALRDGDQLDA